MIPSTTSLTFYLYSDPLILYFTLYYHVVFCCVHSFGQPNYFPSMIFTCSFKLCPHSMSSVRILFCLSVNDRLLNLIKIINKMRYSREIDVIPSSISLIIGYVLSDLRSVDGNSFLMACGRYNVSLHRFVLFPMSLNNIKMIILM